LELLDYSLQNDAGIVTCRATVSLNGDEQHITGEGNGPINAFVQALEREGLKDFSLTDYRSHAVRGGSGSDAAAYIQIKPSNGNPALWGVGLDSSIEKAGLVALVSAYNLQYT